jgi:hypothetical protein
LSLPGVFALALGKDLICRVPKEDIHQASKFAKCEKTLGEQARTPRKKTLGKQTSLPRAKEYNWQISKFVECFSLPCV